MAEFKIKKEKFDILLNLIAKTDNEELQNAFLDYQNEKNENNEGYLNYLKSVCEGGSSTREKAALPIRDVNGCWVASNDEMSKACTKGSRPEFAELLDAFKEQLSYMDENSSIIYEKVNTIKDMRSPEKEPRPEEGQQGGVLGELWACVSRMKKHNAMLNESKKSLVRFIG